MAGTNAFIAQQQWSNHGEKPSTHEEWASFWMEMTRRYCLKKGMTEVKFNGCSEKLKTFFAENRCHPKMIAPDRISTFLTKIHRNDRHLFDDVFQALDALYTTIAEKYPLETKLQLSTITNFSATTTDELLGRLLVELRLKERSERTITTYSTAVRKYLDYIKHTPTIDDRREIEAYLLKLRNSDRLAPRSVNLTSAAISFFYTHIINANQAVEDIPRMRPGKNLPKVYGQGDIEKILNTIQNRKHFLVMILTYGCGLRLGEIRRLRVDDIDWDRSVIRIRGKGSKERDLPIDDSFRPQLKAYISSNPGLVFLFEGMDKGKPYSRRTIQKIYDTACQKAGILRKGGIHSFRHSYATHLLEQGVDINKIKTLLGHSNVTTTQIYTHVSREEIAKIRSPLASLKSFKKGAAP